MFRLIYDPDSFFERQCEDPSLLGPVLVVMAAAAANLISVSIVMSRVTEVFGETPIMQLVVSLSYVTSLVMGSVGVFVAWVAVTAIMYFIAGRLNVERHQFRDLFKLLGWGFVPAVCSGIAAGLATFVVYTQVQFPNDPAQLSAFFESLRSDPTFMVSRILFVVFTVWQGFLWFFAVKNLYDASARTTLLTVVVPTVAWLAVPLSSTV